MKTNKKNIVSALILLAVFVIFTVLIKTVNVAAIGPEGTSVGFAFINETFKNVFPFSETFYKLSEFLGYLALLTCGFFGCVGLAQLIKRKSLKKVDKDIYVLAGFYIVVLACYAIFEKIVINYRPVILDEGLEASYPSSHTILSLCVFASAAYMVERYLKNQKALKTIFGTASIVLAVVTVVFRAFSGVHWFTDIIGGVILSLALLNLFLAFLPSEAR